MPFLVRMPQPMSVSDMRGCEGVGQKPTLYSDDRGTLYSVRNRKEVERAQGDNSDVSVRVRVQESHLKLRAIPTREPSALSWNFMLLVYIH